MYTMPDDLWMEVCDILQETEIKTIPKISKEAKWVYLCFYPLLFASLLFTAICKASSDSHFAFLHFFFLGMVLISVSCTVSQTSVHSSSGTLSDLVP